MVLIDKGFKMKSKNRNKTIVRLINCPNCNHDKAIKYLNRDKLRCSKCQTEWIIKKSQENEDNPQENEGKVNKMLGMETQTRSGSELVEEGII